jgi:NAD(P)H-nitrite reductase large subunit
VIGNGMVGVRLLEDLLARAPDRYAITVFGAEPVPAYNRIALSKVLNGVAMPARSRSNRPRGTPGTASTCASASP